MIDCITPEVDCKRRLTSGHCDIQGAAIVCAYRVANKRAKRIAELEAERDDWREQCQKAWGHTAELEAKLADAESLIDYAELSIDEAVEDGWEPPSVHPADADSTGTKYKGTICPKCDKIGREVK